MCVNNHVITSILSVNHIMVIGFYCANTLSCYLRITLYTILLWTVNLFSQIMFIPSEVTIPNRVILIIVCYRFLMEEDITNSDIEQAIKRTVVNRTFTPVITGSALKNKV